MTNKYEAVFIIRLDLSEDEKKNLFNQINDTILKSKGEIISSSIWLDKQKFTFPIKKYAEGLYYLVVFNLESRAAVSGLTSAYRLNENILRLLITRH